LLHFSPWPKRTALVSAAALLKTGFKINKQLVEYGTGTGKYAVGVTLAPELKFKDGVATNVVLHVDDIKGATLIKGVA
jgi:hypothetical protein